MKFLEIFLGTPEEKAAKNEEWYLSHKPTELTFSEKRRHLETYRISRRLFLRQLGLAVGGAVLAAGGGYKFLEDLAGEDDKEGVYLSYLSSFEKIAKEDQEAENLLRFFKERRKKGIVKNGVFLKLEEGDPALNFYTAVVNRYAEVSGELVTGFANFKQTLTPPVLFLRDTRIDPLFAGVTMVHEAKHIYQWLTGIEQTGSDGFTWGEVDAYETEFRLLDKATGGKFNQVLREQAKSISDEKYRAKLTRDDVLKISALFAPSRSEEEDFMRFPMYTIALNFAKYESQSASFEEARREKFEHINGITAGTRIILMPN